MKKKSRITSIYSQWEMGFVVRFRAFRDKIFLPILKILKKLGVLPNHISFFSGLVVFLAFSGSILTQKWLFYIIGIWFHFLIDALDGALARFLDKASWLGSFFDIISDYLGILSSSIFLLYFNLADSIALLLFSVFYTIVIFNSFALGIVGRPYKYAFRPRVFIFLGLTLDFFWNKKVTPIIILGADFLLAISAIEGLFRLKGVIKEKT